jgi:hypothetical protein
MGRQEVMEGKEEPSQARQNSKRQEDRVPGVESFPGKKPLNHDESRGEYHQAQHDVEEGEGR